MMLIKISTRGLSINSYILIDPLSHQGLVIDPVRTIKPILDKIQELGAEIIALLETHVHADFISGSLELKHSLSHFPPIFCSALGGDAWIPKYADHTVKNGHEFILGSIKLKAVHTPGHTPEHLTWVIYDNEVPVKALTGDFLLAGTVGRPDLLGKANLDALADQLYHSVFHVLPMLPDSLEIYPAHGAGSLCGKGIGTQSSSTLGFERKNNPFLQPQEKEDWVKMLMEQMPTAPTYFSKMKQLNISGAPLFKDLPAIHPLSSNAISDRTIIVDIRSLEHFAKKHLAGSINIPYAPILVNWAGVVLPYDSPLILIGENRSTILSAIDMLRLVGLDQIDGYLIADEHSLSDPKLSWSSLPLISPQHLKQQMKQTPSSLFIIDVRTDSEWLAGHIKGAHHILLNDLQKKMAAIPKDKTVATICGSGYRASIAASLLRRSGYPSVCNVEGGMHAWD